MAPSRTTVLNELAAMIANFRLERPIRVAIDGRTASGKTTLANELAERLQQSEREIIRTSIDGFHRPKVERYARGRHSSEGYYFDARDLVAINRLLLAPLGPGGDRLYRTASHDLTTDEHIEQEPKHASDSAILLVDGTFLQRPELVDNWDLAIFVETAEWVSEERGIGRDSALLGGEAATRELYSTRYKPAFKLYDDLCSPCILADVVVFNDDFDFPIMRLNTHSRVSAGPLPE